MPTDDKALREKLDAMVFREAKSILWSETDIQVHGTIAVRDDYAWRALEAVAIDLLRRLEERETPETADALKRCVWTNEGKSDSLPIWVAGCCNEKGEAWGWTNLPPSCPGCGHPVVVKEVP